MLLVRVISYIAGITLWIVVDKLSNEFDKKYIDVLHLLTFQMPI